MTTPRTYSCFVISPIGPEGSATRKRADTVFEHLIEPVATRCGCSPVLRADHLDRAGIITNQIITHLAEDDLVIADLTDHNPNVFYELAVRHVTRRATVHLIQRGQAIPFDIAAQRVILYDPADWGDLKRCSDTLDSQIRGVLADPASADNPISVAVQLEAFKTSASIRDRQLGELLTRLNSIAAPLRTQPLLEPIPNLRAIAASMKSDLRNLVTAQESFFADNVTYARDLAELSYGATRGNSIRLLGATDRGWWAIAENATGLEYGIWVGEAPQEFAIYSEGEPFQVGSSPAPAY